MRQNWLAAAAAVLTFQPHAAAANFHYGFAGASSDTVQLRLPKPPQYFIARRMVTVEVTAPASISATALATGAVNSLPGVGQQGAYAAYPGTGPAPPQILSSFPNADLDSLRSAAERLMAASGFKIVSAQPETVLRLTVASFDPIKTQQTTLQRSTNVRDPATGQAVTQQIPIDMWEGMGRLALRIEVIDPATNRVLDGFATSDSYTKRGQVGVNGQRTVDPAQLPIADAIWQQFVKTVTEPLQARYGFTEEKVEFVLAAEEDLRPGNQFAKNGNWKLALDKWENATFRKKPAEASRMFNMGAAHEALAYEALRTQSAAAATPLLNKANQLYMKAMEMEPKEKQFQAAGERLRKAAVEFNRGLAQELSVREKATAEQTYAQQVEQQQRAEQAAQAAAVIAQQERVRQFESTRADTAPEATFRKLARVRIRAQNGPASDDERTKLIVLGQQVYKLQPPEAERIVYQESKQWAELLPAIANYRETFAALYGDKRITPSERAALIDLAKSLGLSADDVRDIETQYMEVK